MRAAHQRARATLGVQPLPDARETWGWHGRTLSQPVSAPGGPAWLRLACSPSSQIARTFWDGSVQAQQLIPATVPRPRLRETHDWTDDAWEYRAEVYDRVTVGPIAQSPSPTAVPDLPGPWWAALRTALADITSVATDRYTIEQQYLDWAMPRFLGNTPGTTVPAWTTAHGDLHWANLCAPQLQILDWEGWGLAPAGYDAATLHSYSLLMPVIAERIRAELAEVLGTPGGRFAELVTITEILHSTARGDNLPLAEPLRQRAAHLLNRPAP
jgi:hypothetical protein